MIIQSINGSVHRFCSRCEGKSRCFSCMLPAPDGSKLSDGRTQCRKCSSETVSEHQLNLLVNEVRRDLSRMYGFETSHPIKLHLVDRPAMIRISGEKNAFGCMKVNVNTTVYQKKRRKRTEKKWKCDLYLLSSLPGLTAAKVIAHELTHDYIYHHAGRGREAKITEGICEAVSGVFMESKGYQGYTRSMEKNPDPVYGAGFRLIYPQLKRSGLRGVMGQYSSFFTPF